MLEFLQEQLHADPWLHEWFDRLLENDPETAPSLIAECMPHVVSSRSLNRGKTHHRIHALRSKHDIKIAAIEAALAEYESLTVQPSSNEHARAQLERFLKLYENDPLA